MLRTDSVVAVVVVQIGQLDMRKREMAVMALLLYVIPHRILERVLVAQ
jgi:hypothetical protein